MLSTKPIFQNHFNTSYAVVQQMSDFIQLKANPSPPMSTVGYAHIAGNSTGSVVVSENGGIYRRVISPGVYNVLDYGAKGDGLADDTQAIQTAINIAGSGTVYAPKGTYKISMTLSSNNEGLTIIGDGVLDTVFSWSGTSDVPIFHFGYKWQSLKNAQIAGSCSGVRLASGPSLNQKDAALENMRFQNTGTYGVLIEAGEGVAQCDNNVIRRCQFSGPAIGIELNSGEADFTYITECEFSGCTTAGFVGKAGGFATIRQTIFGACARAILIPVDAAGLEQMLLDTVESESHSSGYMMEIYSTCLTFDAYKVIFGDKNFFASGNNYTLIGCYINQPGIVTDGNGVTITEIGCWWAKGADINDGRVATTRNVTSPSGPGPGNISHNQMERLVLKPEGNAPAVNLETWGPMSSALDHWRAFIDGQQVFRAGLDDITGIFTLGNTSQAQAIKPSTGVGCDVNILRGNNSGTSERVSINMCASPSISGGPNLTMALTDTTAHVALRRNNNQVTLPTSLELQYDDVTKLELVSDGIKIGGGTTISKHLSATMIWDPAFLPADGDVTTVNVTVTDAAVGDTVAVGFPCGNNNVILSGNVSEVDTVRVVLMNKTGSSLNLAPGNLRVDVWKH